MELINAADREDIQAVKALLAKGADVNAQNEYGLTALMAASWRGHGDILDVMV